MHSEKKCEEIHALIEKWGVEKTAKHLNIKVETIKRVDRKYRSLLKREPKKSAPNILLLDIETAPASAYVWRFFKENINQEQVIADWFMIGWAVKWLNEPDVYSDVLTPEEALEKNDARITRNLWEYIDAADIIIGQNACVDKDTPILMQDLTWKKAGDLVVGDKIVGFEEKNKPGETRRNREGKWVGGKGRKITPSEVTNIKIEPRSCMEVEFDNGDKIVTTPDHYWLGMSENCRNQQWYRTDKLRIGQRVNKFISPWKTDYSYEAGWLSGFVSGEGTLKGNGASIEFCQRPNVVLDQALDYCNRMDIDISEPKSHPSGVGKRDVIYSYTMGGKWKTLELLGKLQIRRMIDKLNWNKFGGINSTAQNDTTRTIVNIKNVGTREVAVMETSSATYIAAGYPMHNCSFDIPKINTRFLIHDLTPPSPYYIIDTLVTLKKYFGFSMNRLNYVNYILGLDMKEPTTFQLWVDCLNGNKDALNSMESYNRNDVLILEELYLKLRPWIKSHPNVGLFIDESTLVKGDRVCSYCGGKHFEYCGEYTTPINSYNSYRCLDCGGIGRVGKNSISTEKKEKLLRSIAK